MARRRDFSMIGADGRVGISLKNPIFVRFLLVNAVFTIGFAVLLLNHVYDIVVWIVYVAAWSLVEFKFAHGLALGWKGWAIFMAVLGLIDLTVIWLSS